MAVYKFVYYYYYYFGFSATLAIINSYYGMIFAVPNFAMEERGP